MIKTEGIILKATDLGEADRLLVVYTKELGKLRVIARGIKKTQSKLKYSLEPFSHSRLILVEGKKALLVKDAFLLNQFKNIRQDLRKIKTTYQVINLVDEVIVGQEKDEALWQLLADTLQSIEVTEGNFSVKQTFEKFRQPLFHLLGYDPQEMKTAEDIY